jgi:hypothetical protein
MPPPRDLTLQPMIDPPRRIDPREVRRRWPDAIETLEREGCRGTLSVGSEGTLWFESDAGGRPSIWVATDFHGMAWVPRDEHRPNACGCGRPLKGTGRCSKCGLWPSRCMCPKEA